MRNSFSCDDFLYSHPLYVCCLSWVALYILHVLGSFSFRDLLYNLILRKKKKGEKVDTI